MYLTDSLYNSLDKGQDFTTVYLDITRYFEEKKYGTKNFWLSVKENLDSLSLVTYWRG